MNVFVAGSEHHLAPICLRMGSSRRGWSMIERLEDSPAPQPVKGPGGTTTDAAIMPGVPNHASRASHAGPLRGDSVSSPNATSGESKARGPTPLRRGRCAPAHQACSGAARRCWGEGPGRCSLPALHRRCKEAHTGSHARCARFPELRSGARRHVSFWKGGGQRTSLRARAGQTEPD